MGYSGICVVGQAGTGKTVLAEKLIEHFQLQKYSGGDTMRAIARRMKITQAELEQRACELPEIDREIDAGAVAFAQRTQGFLLDGRCSAWLCRQAHPAINSFNVLLYCGNDKVRFERIAQRESAVQPLPFAYAKVEAETRARENALGDRIKQVHGISLPRILDRAASWYDLVVDTWKWNEQQVFELVSVHYRRAHTPQRKRSAG